MSELAPDPTAVNHAPGLCECDYTTIAAAADACPCCGVRMGQECVNSVADIVRAKNEMERALRALARQDLIPVCRSGAHFLGNCACIGK